MAKKTKEQEIKILRDNLDNPNIPEQFKPDMRKLLEKLESEVGQPATEKTKKPEVVKKQQDEQMVVFTATGITAPTLQKIKDIAYSVSIQGPGYYITVIKSKLKQVHELLEADEAEYEGQKKPELKPDDYDCDSLIEKEKERLAKRKKAAEKREKKPESVQQKERVERVNETVVKSIEERVEKGEKVSKTEIETLIDSLQKQINVLKQILKSI
jgi:hypothetical protein